MLLQVCHGNDAHRLPSANHTDLSSRSARRLRSPSVDAPQASASKLLPCHVHRKAWLPLPTPTACNTAPPDPRAFRYKDSSGCSSARRSCYPTHAPDRAQAPPHRTHVTAPSHPHAYSMRSPCLSPSRHQHASFRLPNAPLPVNPTAIREAHVLCPNPPVTMPRDGKPWPAPLRAGRRRRRPAAVARGPRPRLRVRHVSAKGSAHKRA